ncbi:MAG TPA: hypothetical protein VFS69_05965 [Sphingomicrobium sp.]|nr:hypothetical protein [Sphingomicrobium sp.]
MTIDTDIREKPKRITSEAKLFEFAAPPVPRSSVQQAQLAYADVELSTTVETSDFDLRTVAIVGGIIVFKLSMLGLLLVSI